MSKDTKAIILIIIDQIIFVIWGVVTHDFLGSLWYWIIGALLAFFSELLVQQIKKLLPQKGKNLAFFEFKPLMICLITRYIGWLVFEMRF